MSSSSLSPSAPAVSPSTLLVGRASGVGCSPRTVSMRKRRRGEGRHFVNMSASWNSVTTETTGGQNDHFALGKGCCMFGHAVFSDIGAHGTRNAPRTFWAPTSGNGRVSGNAKTAHFSGNGCFQPTQPREMPGRSPVSPQGTGRMVRDQNEPKFAQKSPGVGFWHALACRRKRVCVACAELSATKTMEQ